MAGISAFAASFVRGLTGAPLHDPHAKKEKQNDVVKKDHIDDRIEPPMTRAEPQAPFPKEKKPATKTSRKKSGITERASRADDTTLKDHFSGTRSIGKIKKDPVSGVWQGHSIHKHTDGSTKTFKHTNRQRVADWLDNTDKSHVNESKLNEMATVKRMHEIPCPRCGAKAGERCKVPTSFHNERATEANRIDAEALRKGKELMKKEEFVTESLDDKIKKMNGFHNGYEHSFRAEKHPDGKHIVLKKNSLSHTSDESNANVKAASDHLTAHGIKHTVVDHGNFGDKKGGHYMVKARIDEEVVNEALKKIGEYKNHDGSRHATVHRDAEWEEYRVKHHKNGVHQTKADYHTDDKEDAHNTAKHWVNSTSEEVTSFVEVFKDTLYGYRSKAVSSAVDHGIDAGRHLQKGDFASFKKSAKKAYNRANGSLLASRKLEKSPIVKVHVSEDALNEIGNTEKGQNALRRYMHKAAHSYVHHDRAADSHFEIGSKFKDPKNSSKALDKAMVHIDKSASRMIGMQRAGKRIKEENEMDVTEGRTFKVDPDHIRSSSKRKNLLKKSTRADAYRASSKRAVGEEVEVVDEGKTFRANSADYRGQRAKNSLRKWSKDQTAKRDAKRKAVGESKEI